MSELITTQNVVSDEVKQLADIMPNSKIIEDPVEASKALVRIYKTLPELMSTLVKKYKFLAVAPKKMVWEANSDDISRNMAGMKLDLNLDKEITSEYASLVNMKSVIDNFCEQLDSVGGFVEWCFTYYIHTISNETPFYKMPQSIMKYRMVVGVLRADKEEHYVRVNKVFMAVLNNELMKRLRNAPPVYITGEYDIEELKTRYKKEVIPLCKELISALLKLPNTIYYEQNMKISLREDSML